MAARLSAPARRNPLRRPLSSRALGPRPRRLPRLLSELDAGARGRDGGKVIAVDGKTLRGSFASALGRSPLHLVNAWAPENNLLLGQLATDKKANESTAIAALLERLALEGAMVTIDAMGCQKTIAQTIVTKGADYVLALKDNPPALRAEVASFFDEALSHPSDEHRLSTAESVEGGTGASKRVGDAPVPRSAGSRRARRGRGCAAWCVSRASGRPARRPRPSAETIFTSLDGRNPVRMGEVLRVHGGVENGLHWVLDVTFREDACRVRKDHGPQNLARPRKLALSLYKQEPSKLSARPKRLQALWRHDYLLDVLGFSLKYEMRSPCRPRPSERGDARRVPGARMLRPRDG